MNNHSMSTHQPDNGGNEQVYSTVQSDESDPTRVTLSRFVTISLQCFQQIAQSDNKGNLLLHVMLFSEMVSVEDALMMMEKYPAALQYIDDYDNLPLHVECKMQCKPLIISKCIELYPEALSKANKKGYLPLHLLLLKKSSSEITGEFMIEKYPAALLHQDANGDLPLHIECANRCRSSIIAKCIELYPEALSKANKKGYLPLHLLLLKKSSSAIVAEIMIEKYPAALAHQNANGDLPLHVECFIHSRPSILSKCIKLYPGALALTTRRGHLPLHLLLMNESSSADDAVMMIEKYPAALQHQDLCERLPLHVECSKKCRSSIISKCIELYPEALSVGDENGNLPLHVLFFNESSCTDGALALIDTRPASLRHLNRNGRYPLHVELKSQCRPSIISKCIEIYPAALAKGDKMTYIGLRRYVNVCSSDELLSMIEFYTDTRSPLFQHLQRDDGSEELLVDIHGECVRLRKSCDDMIDGFEGVKLDPDLTVTEDKPDDDLLHKLLEDLLSDDDMLMLIEAYPESLQQPNEKGELPLHIECKKHCRPSIIWKSVELYQDALKVADMRGNLPIHRLLSNKRSTTEDALMMIEKFLAALQHRNGNGNLPLHIESIYQQRSSVISKCIEVYPEALEIKDMRGNLSLHWLMRNRKSSVQDVLMMIEKYPAALRQQNEHGELPLHIECKYSCRPIVIWKCFEISPEALAIADGTGNMPLHWLLWDVLSTIDDVMKMIEKYPKALRHKNKDGHLPLLIERRYSCRKPVILKCIELYPESLLDAYQSGYLPLHSLLADNRSPIDDALMVMEKYPPVLRLQDGSGQFPLHIECQHQCRSPIIAKCIEVYSNALEIADKDGCLPLHLILWNDNASTEVALMMMREYPGALQHQDRSGYLPIHVECFNQCRVSVLRPFVELYPQVLVSKVGRFKAIFVIVLDKFRQANCVSEVYKYLPAISYLAERHHKHHAASYTKLVREPCFQDFHSLDHLKRRILLNLIPNDKIADGILLEEKRDLNWQTRSLMLWLMRLVDIEVWLMMTQQPEMMGEAHIDNAQMTLLYELTKRSSLVDVNDDERGRYAVCQGDELGDHLLRHVISYL
jgi:ankyrin repeat protein